MDNLPPAVLAYLEEAALAVAQEQNFSTTSEPEFSNWLDANFCKIVLKAKKLQFNCWVKLFSSKETYNLVSETISQRVWNTYNQPKKLT